jgi:hypothetical protein
MQTQIWEDALSRSKEYGVGQQLVFLVLRTIFLFFLMNKFEQFQVPADLAGTLEMVLG